MIGLKSKYAVCRIMSKVYPALLKQLTIRLKKIREVLISNDFLEFIYQITIEFLIKNTLLQTFIQTNMIFFDQFKVPTIKFGKCSAEFL